MSNVTEIIHSLVEARLQESRAPLDKDGNPLVDMNDTPVPTNPDGTLTLYHRTSEDSAKKMRATGRFHSKENTDETFFSSHSKGYASDYGNHVVAIKIHPRFTRINDAFHNGEVHVAVKNRHISRANIVK